MGLLAMTLCKAEEELQLQGWPAVGRGPCPLSLPTPVLTLPAFRGAGLQGRWLTSDAR